MSKNVAVFVDVANIFYAAKAAGVDIDYVTLLKVATAGRDFVRAYAYTGLDPENENQRQFHSFLSRSGYKVISKDIRKYGDGRIKANLDIELVVDMMKTARNLDIAVVVSGDGDFAPAVRAVQEMGVRVEVISFRGNTSSDLIDVADQFTDIAQIARVEKASARSGRRVAAEGDLSMTEVPEKETEGAPRRRRGRGREEQAVAESIEALPEAGNVIMLPGERLSRAAPGEPEVAAEDEGEELDYGAGNGRDAAGEENRRRRRRRGGRGRGRGRRADEAPVGVGDEVSTGQPEEEEEFEELPPAQLPHHTFGSVWDSQLGVPSASMPTSVDIGAGAGVGEEEDDEEPEVPEYLLAERRQRGQRQGRSRTPRGRSAYQAALDRERYGRGAPQPSFGGGRAPDRGRDRGRSRPQQGGRPPRQQRSDERPQMLEQRASSEPWSEVPPELEEMLRAELSRKQPASSAPAPEGTEPAMDAAGGSGQTADIEAKPTRRRRSTKAATSASSAPEVEVEPAGTEAATPAKRATRSRSTRATTKATPRSRTSATTVEQETAETAPKKPATRRRATTSRPRTSAKATESRATESSESATAEPADEG